MSESTDRRGSEVVALADDWAAAIVANDVERIASFVTDDWVMVSDTGVAPGEHFLALVGSGALTHSSMQRVGPTRVRIYGEVAAARRSYPADEWSTDIFVRQNGRWHCVLSHITAASASTRDDRD